MGADFWGAVTGAKEGDSLGEDAVEDMLLDDVDREGVFDTVCPVSDTADDPSADADMGPVSLFLRDPVEEVVDATRDDAVLTSDPLFDTNTSAKADSGDDDDDTASRGDPVSLMVEDEMLLL